MPDLHTATQGEAWDLIAFDRYPDLERPELLMHRLLEANPGLRETVIFSGGESLRIPAEPEPGPLEGLPPWKA